MRTCLGAWKQISRYCGGALWLGPWSFSFSALPTGASSSSSVTAPLSCPAAVPRGAFWSGESWLCICRLPLQSWGQKFAVCPSPFYRSKKIVDFSVCIAFYLLLGWKGYGQALYLNAKQQMAWNLFLCKDTEVLSKEHQRFSTAICNNMDGPWGYFTKWSKSEKYCTYVESLKKIFVADDT